ncbi:MAG: peptide chain release factor N(5)-glutamine methyltransferase [Chlamydiota bacterium]
MITLIEVLKRSADFLKDKGVTRARRVAEELFAHVLKVKRLDLYLQYDRPMIESELEEIRGLLRRASRNEPFEQIIGKVSFCHCDIKVTSDVLIPRPETEILVETICRQLKDESNLVVWDICTGSGYIGIAIKKAIPALCVTLSDISDKALGVAAENAAGNGVEVELKQGDLLAPFQGLKADVVICNPPYISESEYLSLDPCVRDFEPKCALVGGAEGVEFYRRLAADLPPYLNPGAKLFFEIGTGQGEALKSIFHSPCWREKRVEKDWAGHDRFFFLEFE